MANCRYQVPYEPDLSIPSIVVDNVTMKELVSWFVTHLIRNQVAEGNVAAHFQMDWYGMSQDKLTAMKTAAPTLSYIKRDIHGLRHLLHICEKDSVQTRVKKDAISVVILAALPAAAETMNSYYTPHEPRPPDNTLYNDFVRYVQVTRSTVTYMERKIFNVIDLLAVHDKFRSATDPMPSHLFDLDLGDMTLAEAKQKGKLAVALQKRLETAYCL